MKNTFFFKLGFSFVTDWKRRCFTTTCLQSLKSLPGVIENGANKNIYTEQNTSQRLVILCTWPD